jgi:hypothetical protein
MNKRAADTTDPIDRPAGRPFASFREFYPFYLAEHADVRCRRLHFAGTTLVIATAVFALVSGHLAALALAPVFGYGCAWVGHFCFEHNRPATFKAPLYSLFGDWVMYAQMISGRIRL